MIYLKFLTEYYALRNLVSSQITTDFKIQRHLKKNTSIESVFLLQKISLIVSITYLLIEISCSQFAKKRIYKEF